MKSFSSVGWSIANKGAIGLKIGAVIAATSAIAVTSYVISNKATKKKVDKTSQVKIKPASFNFDNLIFPVIVTDIIPENKIIVEDKAPQKTSFNLPIDITVNEINPPEVVESILAPLPPIKLASLTSSNTLSSKYEFSDEDFDYFNKYGIEREITDAAYIGGSEEMQAHINDNIKYPKEARERQVEGTVIVQFDLNRFGEVENPRIIKSVSEELDREALKIACSFKKWEAKKVNFIPVKSVINVPITFELN